MTTQLCTYEEARQQGPGSLATLAAWMAEYPMSGHADLGRTGAVCPFLKRAARRDILRVGISLGGPEDEQETFELVRESFSELERIAAPEGMERLRTIVYGFPNCGDADDLAMLQRIYKRHKYYTLTRFRMIAFFHAGSETGGLWNPAFRPMRAPMPLLGVRYLIEQDSIFAAKHRLMILPYVMRFGPAGARRLAAHWRGRPEVDATADV